jgi:glycine C-acetyltransferase
LCDFCHMRLWRGCSDHPIVPVMLGDAKLAADFADAMLSRGINVIGFSFPVRTSLCFRPRMTCGAVAKPAFCAQVVPRGLARIRVQISACHSPDDIAAAIDAFISVGKQMKVIG